MPNPKCQFCGRRFGGARMLALHQAEDPVTGDVKCIRPEVLGMIKPPGRFAWAQDSSRFMPPEVGQERS